MKLRGANNDSPKTADLSGIVEDAKLFFKIGLKLSTEHVFPEWREGSEFKKQREGAANERK